MTDKRKWLLFSVLLFVTLMFAAGLIFQPRLAVIHTVIKKQYQVVSPLSASQFVALDAHTVVVFNVREPKKLEVSSIEDAIQLMPSTDSVELIEDYNDLFEIKNLCFIARLVGAHLHW